jgi:L-fuconolactonase
VVRLFGAERLLWGSDWPVLELAGDFEGWFKDNQKYIQSLTKNQQEQVFCMNAKRIYKL